MFLFFSKNFSTGVGTGTNFKNNLTIHKPSWLVPVPMLYLKLKIVGSGSELPVFIIHICAGVFICLSSLKHVLVFFFLDQERSETEQKVHEAMEAALACGSGGQPQRTASRQSEAAQKSLKRAGAPSDQGRNMMNTAWTNQWCGSKYIKLIGPGFQILAHFGSGFRVTGTVCYTFWRNKM